MIDDHSRVAYAEIYDDETADTAIAVLRRAVSWFADRGVDAERVMDCRPRSTLQIHQDDDTCVNAPAALLRPFPLRVRV